MIDYRKYPHPRLRHHGAPTLYLKKENFTFPVQNYPPLIEKVDWAEHYRRGKQPEYIDIGCGLGKFLLDSAYTHGERDYLGLEVRRSAVEWINDVVQGENLTNVRAEWYSVANGLPFLEDASVEHVYYFFPDPWLKKRHNKRRAFSPELLAEIYRILKPDGTLHLMTDVLEVREYQLQLVEESGKFFARKITGEEDWGLHIATDHEIFCRRRERPYFRHKVSKVG